MVEDSQIKAEVSPFAIREGEIKVFDGKDGYVSMNQIINKINLGHITDTNNSAEIDPIKTDTSDSNFLFDNDDAIIVDLKRGNSNK